MKNESMEIYSELSNHGIVRMPDREYPGAVVQGDSLFSDALDIVEELKTQPESEAFHTALSLAEKLEDRLRHYIEVCEANRIEWKFDVSRSTQDYASLIDNDL